MKVPGTYERLPCGKCEIWVEETAGDRAFMLHTSHDRPERCQWYSWIQSETKEQGKPVIVIDARPRGGPAA